MKLRVTPPLKLSTNPEKAKHGMTDVKCLIGGHTLFVNDSNPCRGCSSGDFDQNIMSLDILRDLVKDK
jgi:hypothetical protein